MRRSAEQIKRLFFSYKSTSESTCFLKLLFQYRELKCRTFSLSWPKPFRYHFEFWLLGEPCSAFTHKPLCAHHCVPYNSTEREDYARGALERVLIRLICLNVIERTSRAEGTYGSLVERHVRQQHTLTCPLKRPNRNAFVFSGGSDCRQPYFERYLTASSIICRASPLSSNDD